MTVSKKVAVNTGVTSSTEVAVTQEMCVGSISRNRQYSTHFARNFNVDGSPANADLEKYLNAPQDNIEGIFAHSKYVYRKHGIIMRTVNIMRDFGASGLRLQYPVKADKVKQAIENFNENVDIEQFVRDAIFELAISGNLVCYYRNGKRIDIYPINQIEMLPLMIDNKQILGYKIENKFMTKSYGKQFDSAIQTAYPKEIVESIKKGEQLAYLDPKYSFSAKINCSQYEPYGVSCILPAFEDLAHKTLMKEAEKSISNELINKILLVKIGDKDNKPNARIISEYTNMLDNISGAVRLTVPYYVQAQFVEPETAVFGAEKFIEIDSDVLSTLGISLSLLKGEGGGNYSEGIINMSSLTRTIETMQRPIAKIIEEMYRIELERKGLNPEHCPKVSFNEVVIDKASKLALVKELFVSAGLPYEVMYNEYGYDFESLKIMKEQENKETLEEVFKLHTQPFQGTGQPDANGDGEAGAPKKKISERKTEPRGNNQSTGLKNTNRTKE